MQYFIIKNKIQQGPFTIEDLKEFGVQPNDKVWKDGLPEWVNAAGLPELQHLFGSKPPPLSDSILAEEEKHIAPQIMNTATICLIVYLAWEAVLGHFWQWLYRFFNESARTPYVSLFIGLINLAMVITFAVVIKNRKARTFLIIITIVKFMSFASGYLINNFF